MRPSNYDPLDEEHGMRRRRKPQEPSLFPSNPDPPDPIGRRPGIIRPHFDGETCIPSLDYQRLDTQLARVFQFLHSLARADRRTSNPTWTTLATLASASRGSESAVSARIRDLRKPKFGGYTIHKRRKGDPNRGLWEYRMEPEE